MSHRRPMGDQYVPSKSHGRPICLIGDPWETDMSQRRPMGDPWETNMSHRRPIRIIRLIRGLFRQKAEYLPETEKDLAILIGGSLRSSKQLYFTFIHPLTFDSRDPEFVDLSFDDLMLKSTI